MSLHESAEMYIETIYRLSQSSSFVRSIDVAEAMGYSKERVNKAQGDAARFDSVYEEYAKSKDITKTRLYIETMEEIFKGDKAGDLVDKNLENFLPLKNIQPKGGAR